MNNQNQLDLSLMDINDIKTLRQQLARFSAAEGSLEVLFYLPNGDEIRVPVSKKSKVELLSKEVRNLLAEEQLILQTKAS